MSKHSDSFSINFALIMARLAERSQMVWLKHNIDPYPDDDPQALRHLSITIERPGFKDIAVECFVHKVDKFWARGSAIVRYLQDGKAVSAEPETFFINEYQRGLRQVRKVPVLVMERGGHAHAQVLDNPDSKPSLRDQAADRLPSAVGIDRRTALGRLVEENPDLFGVDLRFGRSL